jgi:Na+/H+-dicarboxylate symporter
MNLGYIYIYDEWTAIHAKMTQLCGFLSFPQLFKLLACFAILWAFVILLCCCVVFFCMKLIKKMNFNQNFAFSADLI